MQPKSAKAAELEATFNKLAEQIKKDTGFSSHIAARVNHPAYEEVIRMGEPALPLIFQYMEEGKGGFWFHALAAITETDPIPRDLWGKIREMENVWLTWAREQGYCW